MILQIGADARHVGDHVDAEAVQQFARADAGELQQLRRVECAAGQDHLAAGTRDAGRAALLVFDADGAPAFEQNARRQRVGHDREIAAAAAPARDSRRAVDQRRPLRR